MHFVNSADVAYKHTPPGSPYKELCVIPTAIYQEGYMNSFLNIKHVWPNTIVHNNCQILFIRQKKLEG